MRVLIAGITYAPSLNGQAIFTTNLAEGLVKQGYEVMVAFPGGRNSSHPRVLNGVQLAPLKSVSLEFIHEDAYTPFRFKSAIARLFDDFQPDVIHIQDHYPVCSAVVRLAQKRGIKVIGTNHFMPENVAPYIPFLSKIKPLFNWLMWHLVLEVYNRVDVVTAQSPAAADILHSQGLRKPIYPVSCGIDLNHFHPNPNTDRNACRGRYHLDPAKTVFLFVGRVDREKRIDTLIHAFSLLSREDVQLGIAGSGAAFNELKALAERLKLGERVRFLGPIPMKDLPTLLNSADIFVMPSTAELLSIATLEAMACGRPVLLANAVALSSLVGPDNGFLFEPGNAEDAARYIELLAGQRDRWKEMGKVGLEIAQAHSLEKTLAQYEMLYEGLLRNTSLMPSLDFPSKVKRHPPIKKITKKDTV